MSTFVANTQTSNPVWCSEGVSWHHTHRELTWIIPRWANFEDTQFAHRKLTRWAYIMSFLWAFHEFPTHTVSSLLLLHSELIGMISWIAHSNHMVWVANSQKAHSKLIVYTPDRISFLFYFSAIIYEVSGNINIPFYVCGCFPVLGGLLMIFVFILQRRGKVVKIESWQCWLPFNKQIL